jgi:hypothetical protein
MGGCVAVNGPRRYPSDTSDTEWEIAALHIPARDTRAGALRRQGATACVKCAADAALDPLVQVQSPGGGWQASQRTRRDASYPAVE